MTLANQDQMIEKHPGKPDSMVEYVSGNLAKNATDVYFAPKGVSVVR